MAGLVYLHGRDGIGVEERVGTGVVAGLTHPNKKKQRTKNLMWAPSWTPEVTVKKVTQQANPVMPSLLAYAFGVLPCLCIYQNFVPL